MFNKKGQMTRMLVVIILAVVALTLFLFFYTGQWDKLVGSLTNIENSAVGNVPPPTP